MKVASLLTLWLLLLGADCGRATQQCVDYAGEEIVFTNEDPEGCFSRPIDGCPGIEFPTSFRVRVTSEPAQRREFMCEIPRAEVVGAFGNLELDGPSTGSVGLWLSGSTRFAIAEEARVRDTDCTGALYVNIGTLPSTSPETNPDYWLTLPPGETDAAWVFSYAFYPDDVSLCSPMDSLECGSRECVVRAERAGP